MKLLLSLTFLVIGWQSLACRPIAPKNINFHVDLEKGIRKFYSSKRLLDDRPSLSLENCEGTSRANKFIMVGLGLENLVLTNDVMGFNFTPQEESVRCELRNNPFEIVETADDRFEKSKLRRDFFNRCMVMQVTELNENIELRMPEKQPGCTIKKRSKWSYDVSGSYCFIQPYEKSKISIHLDVREECLNKENLNQKKTIIADYNALLNTYIAGDATGFSADLTAATTTSVRFSMTPPKGHLELSEDFGVARPRWPTTWQGADLFFGELAIRKLDEINDEIKVPLVANTICKRKCVGNLCTSPCDYSQPIVGEYTLYEIVNGKKEFIKLWHDGSIASAHYQGLLHGVGVTVQRGVLEEGKIYSLEAVFREPELDYSYFNGRVARLLKLERNYIGPFSRTGQIGLIPQISTISRSEEIPDVPVIRNLTFENSNLDGLSVALATWQSKLDNAFWPPFYDKMCSSLSGECENSGSGYVTLKANFTLSEGLGDFWTVNLLEGKRESNIVSNKTWSADEVATVSCGNNDDEDDDFDWGDIL